MTEQNRHFATVTPATHAYQVVYQGEVILESDQALQMNEHYDGKDYPAVIYFPTLAALPVSRSDHSSYCPIKGEASYWNYGDAENAIWSYPDPMPGVAAIRDYYGFMQTQGFEIREIP